MNKIEINKNRWAVYGINGSSWSIGKIVDESSTKYTIQYFEKKTNPLILCNKEEVHPFNSLEDAVKYFINNSSPWGYHLVSREEILNSLEIRFPIQSRKEYAQNLVRLLTNLSSLKKE